MTSSIDPDDWAKEDCVCGHRRHQHGPNGCRHTKQTRVAPEGLAWAGDGFEAVPSVLVGEWPLIEVACCTGFYEAGLWLTESGPS